MNLEQLDLAAVAEMLDHALAGGVAEGYVRGRTILRDALVGHFRCSQLEAEELVDTMIGRGFVTFSGDATMASGAGAWSIRRS